MDRHTGRKTWLRGSKIAWTENGTCLFGCGRWKFCQLRYSFRIPSNDQKKKKVSFLSFLSKPSHIPLLFLQVQNQVKLAGRNRIWSGMLYMSMWYVHAMSMCQSNRSNQNFSSRDHGILDWTVIQLKLPSSARSFPSKVICQALPDYCWWQGAHYLPREPLPYMDSSEF